MAAQAVERLYRLQVDASQATRQLKKINTNTNRIAKGFSGIQRAAAAAFTAMGAVRGLQGMVTAADQIELLEGSFKALTGSAERAADMTERVFSTVAETGASLKDTTSTFQRLTIGFRELGGTNEQIEAVAQTFIKLGRISGTSMFDTNAALVQFSQGLASGKLQGDELRSIMERLPLITELIADEFSLVNDNIEVTRGQVKELGRQGKLTADIMGNALLRASDKIGKQFEGLVFTMEQELNSLQSTWTQIVADFAVDTGAADGLRSSIGAANATLIKFNTNLREAIRVLSELWEVSEAVQLAITSIGIAIGYALLPSFIKFTQVAAAFAASNPLGVVLVGLGLLIVGIILNFEELAAYIRFRLPEAFYTFLGKAQEILGKIEIGLKSLGPKIANSFIDAFNKAINKYNSFLNVLSDFSGVDFGQIGDIGLVELGEQASEFAEDAKDSFSLAAVYGKEYNDALVDIANSAEDAAAAQLKMFEDQQAALKAAAAAEEYAKKLDKFKEKVEGILDPFKELKEQIGFLRDLLDQNFINENQFAIIVAELNGTTDALEKTAEASIKAKQDWEDYVDGLKDQLDPMREVEREISKINIAIEAGDITAKQGEILKEMAIEAAAGADKILTALERIKQATDGFAREFTDTLVEGLKTGEYAFEDFAASILETMSKIVLNSIFEKFFAVVFGALTGGGGIFSAFGGGGAGAARLSSPSVRATGDGESGVGILRPPTYGSGALGGAGSSAVQVTVNNNAPVDVETRTSESAGGGMNIDIIIEQKVNKAISTGGLDKAMQSNFGISRRAF